MKSPKTGEQISNHEYHHGPEWVPLLSSTRFKPMAYLDPAAFRWAIPMKDGPATDGGTGAHTAILDPDRMDDLMVLPDIGFRSNAEKDAWREWLLTIGAEGVEGVSKKDDILALARTAAAMQGKSILSPYQLETTRAMSESVLECDEAVAALSGGLCEQSFRANGLKARPDCLADGLLSDLKTCARFDRFDYQANDLHYPFSLAFYERVLRSCGVSVSGWAWIVVESAPYRMAPDGLPRHRVKVVTGGKDLRWETRNTLTKALDLYRECKDAGEWPAYQIETDTLKTRY